MSDKKTMNYWDVIKYIHPDWNPNIQNPSIKMAEATDNKDDEEALYMLAVKWGLIEDDSINKFDDIQYTIDRGKIVKVNQDREGIIIDLYEQNQLLIVIVYISGNFRAFKRKDVNDQDNDFFVIGIANDSDYTNLDFKYQMMYAQRQEG